MAAPSEANILAIDLGTGGPKVALVSTRGEVVSDAFEPTPLVLTEDGGVEQDPEGWWNAITAASRRAIADAPAGTPPPVAVAVTAQWVTTVAIDEDANPLMNAVSWMDGRGAPYARRAAGPGPRVAGYNPLKLARWLRVTGGAPSLSGHDPVGQILLIQDRHPDVYERTRAFVEPGDFLTARMTGRIVSSAESATVCWGTDNRKIDAIAYDDGLLKLSGLSREKLPEIVPSGSIVGELLPARAAELGIDPVPVVASSPDIMSAAIGSGAVADYAAHLYVGTSGWLSCHVPFKKTDPFHNVAALPSSIAGRYLVCTEQQCAGATLAHLRDNLLGAPEISFNDLVAEAGECGPGAGGVLFTPWLNGERTPLDDHHVRAAYANLSLATTRGALVRATLEGVALNARWMQLHTEKLVGRELNDIAFIGGGAESSLWAQIFADVLGRRINRIAEPRKANTRGAALLASLALGHVRVGEIPERVRTAESHEPNAANSARYDELFDEFRGFYKANRKMYTRLNRTNKGATT
ncbi:MAG: FGGY-family carbohydrate kinase [Actinobacteria bacterium]|nr:FGGY-family carbohydrate kinase [Actinomycetota bacterium]